jgi:hypothetical protein
VEVRGHRLLSWRNQEREVVGKCSKIPMMADTRRIGKLLASIVLIIVEVVASMLADHGSTSARRTCGSAGEGRWGSTERKS